MCRLQQRGGVAVAGLLLLDRGEHRDGLLPVLFFEVVDSLCVAVGEFGFADLGFRVRDDSTGIGVVWVKLGQFLFGGHYVFPPSGLVECRHLVDECAESLGRSCLLQLCTSVPIGRIDRTNILQRGDRSVPVVAPCGGGCLIRPRGQIPLSLSGREEGCGVSEAGLLLLDRGE